jgi:hypothetical protein
MTEFWREPKDSSCKRVFMHLGCSNGLPPLKEPDRLKGGGQSVKRLFMREANATNPASAKWLRASRVVPPAKLHTIYHF